MLLLRGRRKEEFWGRHTQFIATETAVRPISGARDVRSRGMIEIGTEESRAAMKKIIEPQKTKEDEKRERPDGLSRLVPLFFRPFFVSFG